MGSFSRFMVIIPFSEKQKEEATEKGKKADDDSKKEEEPSTASFETSKPLTTSASQPVFANYSSTTPLINFTLDEGNRSKSFADKDKVAELKKEDGGLVFQADGNSTAAGNDASSTANTESDVLANLANTLERKKLGFPDKDSTNDKSASSANVSHKSFEVASMESLVSAVSDQSASALANGAAASGKKKASEANGTITDSPPQADGQKTAKATGSEKPVEDKVVESDKAALNGIVNRQLSKRDLHASVGEDSTDIDDYVGRLTFEEVLC